MTKEQALALTERIRTETPLIQATFDESQARNGHGYQVKVHFAQREFTLNDLDDWTSIKWAWEVEDTPERKRRRLPKYLVDGVPSSIAQNSNGTWFARYWRHGKEHRKYLGKVDPRPNYSLVEEDKAS